MVAEKLPTGDDPAGGGGTAPPAPVNVLSKFTLEQLAVELLTRFKIATAGQGTGDDPATEQTVLDRLKEVWLYTAEGLVGKLPVKLTPEQIAQINEQVAGWLSNNVSSAELHRLFAAGAAGIAATLRAGKGETRHVAAHLA